MSKSEDKKKRHDARLDRWAKAHEVEDRRISANSRSDENGSDQAPTQPDRAKQLAVAATVVFALFLLSSVLTQGFAPQWLGTLGGFSMFYLVIYAIWRASLRRKPRAGAQD
jgi:hypothetical protein